MDDIDLVAYEQRPILQDEWNSWLLDLADWRHYLTLTFKDEVPPDIAMKRFYSLVMILNKSLFGKNYTRKVGHSYFSYILGIEYQRRGVIHFHLVIDRPIDYQLIHSIWNKIAGFAWVEQIENKEQVIKYVTKYVIKGGDILPYKAKSNRSPSNLPYWWSKSLM